MESARACGGCGGAWSWVSAEVVSGGSFAVDVPGGYFNVFFFSRTLKIQKIRFFLGNKQKLVSSK